MSLKPAGSLRAGESPAPLRALRVCMRGRTFPPPRLAQARTCKSGTRALKTPGASPGPALRGVAAALSAGAGGKFLPREVRGRRRAYHRPWGGQGRPCRGVRSNGPATRGPRAATRFLRQGIQVSEKAPSAPPTSGSGASLVSMESNLIL